MSDDVDTIREALAFMRDCFDRPGMHDEGEAALVALDRIVAERDEARQALRELLLAWENADHHIREQLQPEFERLGEHRLATWWHGYDMRVDRARAVLGSLTEGEQ